MALQVEFANVIARLRSVERRVAGGLDAYAARHANYTHDDHLCRVGFMSTSEAAGLRDELASSGLGADEVTIVESTSGLPSWLEYGALPDGHGVWLRGTEPGPLIPTGFGFLLRGPASLANRFSSVLTAQGMTIESSPERVAGAIGYTVRQDRAAVALDVITSGGNASGFWAMREPERPASRFVADLALSHRIEEILRQEGGS
ncbi:hypothetical protein [Aquihabitans sp. McL0605]|uniref:hypothetical protein n=1 Tax=Aquihabitans sp. McL0605 TaxID=3415671 RepID=UPI003CFB60C0